MNYIIPLRSRPLRAALILLLLLAGLALPFIGLGNELPGRDEAYQALCVMNYRQSPIAMLTFYVGNLWIGLFGNEILNLRRLMVLCYQLSIAMACGYMYYKLRKPLLCALLFMVLCTAFRYAGMWLYGWDAGAYPSMTLFTLAMLLYVERPSVGRIALVGAAMAVMALSRIPTLAALPFILAFIIYVRRRGDHKEGRWRLVAADCAVGLAAMAAVALLLILLMTGGSLSAYIHAWTPDNIINGHFDRELVLWRWKDVTRRVVAAFLPMMMCFACACFMMRVRRWRRANLLASALVCILLSVFFFKTYLLYEEYAAGILLGLFLILLFLPLLYNVTHGQAVNVRPLPLLVVGGCALLAAVGSDGFLERPMTVNTVPLLLAFIYTDRLKRVLRYFLGLAASSLVAVYVLYLLVTMASPQIDFGDKPHCVGILQRIVKGDERLVCFQERAAAIEKYGVGGNKCAVIGTGRYVFDYIYNDSTAYSLHYFHYNDRDDDIAAISGVVDVYRYVMLVGDYPATEEYLKGCGYEIEERSDCYTLLAKPRSVSSINQAMP